MIVHPLVGSVVDRPVGPVPDNALPFLGVAGVIARAGPMPDNVRPSLGSAVIAPAVPAPVNVLPSRRAEAIAPVAIRAGNRPSFDHNRPNLGDNLGIVNRPNSGNTVVNRPIAATPSANRPNSGNTVVNRPNNINTNIINNNVTNLSSTNVTNVANVNRGGYGGGYGGLGQWLRRRISA